MTDELAAQVAAIIATGEIAELPLIEGIPARPLERSTA